MILVGLCLRLPVDHDFYSNYVSFSFCAFNGNCSTKKLQLQPRVFSLSRWKLVLALTIRLFAFGFLPFDNGFAVCIWYEGIPQKTVVWTANRNNPPVSRNPTIVFTSDGRLILQELGGQEKSITGAADPAFIASILDSGNLVLYNLNSRIIWQSFDYPTDSLLPGQALRANGELVSSISETNHSKGCFRILMQNDGNLVMYPVDSPQNGDYSYWTTHTNFGFAGDNAKLMLDGSGRLYMLNKTGVLFTNLTNSGVPSDRRIYRAAIDAYGMFRLYSLQFAGNSN